MALIAYDPFDTEKIMAQIRELYRNLAPQVLPSKNTLGDECTEVTQNSTSSLRSQLEKRLENVIFLRDELVPGQLPEEITEIDPVSLKRAKNLPRGAWLDYSLGAQNPKIRCRLAAIIKASQKYIFIDRAGHKIAEKSLVEVATLIASEGLVLIDSDNVFDAALASVISEIRNNTTAETSY